MKPPRLVQLLLGLSLALELFTSVSFAAPLVERARLIALADMGNEPDEEQQMLHLLMCANEFEVEGLLAVTGKYLRPKDSLRFSWWNYPEAGRQPYAKALVIENPSAKKIRFTIPPDAAGKELHLILEVRDQSAIVPLVDYRRAVITIAPKS